MNYSEARAYLDQAAQYGSVLGLANIKELLKRLGNPQNDLRFIHIAGTNGKGSVLAYLSTVLKNAGCLVGRYISPTLFGYRERIQVNEQRIGKEELAFYVSQIERAILTMTEENFPHPTPFEIETALSFLYFKEQSCDIVVLETGLGGLEDATNIVTTSILEIITSVSMDHMGFLGNTLEEIAYNKAGIIKPHTMVVSAEQKPEVLLKIREKCQKEKCTLRIASQTGLSRVVYGWEEQQLSYQSQNRYYENIRIHLAGSYQIANAVVALEAIDALIEMGYPITMEQVRKGMEEAVWRGRFTVLNKNPLVIIDGAHNEDAARTLKESIETYFPNKKCYFIMGMFADKECDKVAKITAPLAQSIITIQAPNNLRALSAGSLADIVSRYHTKVHAADTIEEAVGESMESMNEEDVLIAFGSLSFLGEIAKTVECYQRRKDCR